MVLVHNIMTMQNCYPPMTHTWLLQPNRAPASPGGPGVIPLPGGPRGPDVYH